MKIGCCLPGGSFMPQGIGEVSPDAKAILLDGCAAAEKAGYDYIEATAGLIMQLSEAELKSFSVLKDKNCFSLEICNSFIPSDFKICSGENRQELKSYVQRVMERLNALGIDTVVFGSGSARAVPPGKNRDRCIEELDLFLEMCSRFGERYNVTVAIEPLNKKECNIFNTAAETAAEIRKLNLPKIKLLADAYHMFCEGEEFGVLERNIDILAHIHISEPPERVYPGKNGGGYLKKFAAALKKAGYNGRVTAECGFSDFFSEIIPAAIFMKNNF